MSASSIKGTGNLDSSRIAKNNRQVKIRIAAEYSEKRDYLYNKLAERVISHKQFSTDEMNDAMQEFINKTVMTK